MRAVALTLLAASLVAAHASPVVDLCTEAAAQMAQCRQPPLASLAPAAAEAHCCKPYLQLLLSNCFCHEDTAAMASSALTQDTATMVLQHCPVTTFQSPCGDPLLRAAEPQQEDTFAGDAWAAGSQVQVAAEATFLEALRSEMQTRVEIAKLDADAERFPELRVLIRPSPPVQPRPEHSQAMAREEDPMAVDYVRPLQADPQAGDYLQPQAATEKLLAATAAVNQAQAAVGQAREAVGKLHAASRTVEAVAGYLRALGDSTQDATAIDLDMGVSSQPAAADGSLLRVQESEDGTSFVLEFTLDANDAEAEQLVQSGYQILAGNAPENDQLAARFQSGDMRAVAGALEDLFATIAKRGQALKAADPGAFQMDLMVDVAEAQQETHEGAHVEEMPEAAVVDETLVDFEQGELPRLLAVQDLSVLPLTEGEQQFLDRLEDEQPQLCALAAGDPTPCRSPGRASHMLPWGPYQQPLGAVLPGDAGAYVLPLAGLIVRWTAVVALVALLAATARRVSAARWPAAEVTQQAPEKEPLLKPFAPESAFHILPNSQQRVYAPV